MFAQLWALHPLLKLQLLCSLSIISGLTGFTGKILNTFCQAALNALTVNSDTVVTPAAVVVLGINLFLLSTIEVVLEIYIPRESVSEDDN